MSNPAEPTAQQLVEKMINAINDHVIVGQEEYWSSDMKWYGPAGIGTMQNLAEFQNIHQRNFLHGFPDKYADDEIRFGDGGQWAAAHGYQYATHLGEYLGIPATGKKVKVRYMDIWRSEGGKLVENWVMIDFIDFMNQIGIDVIKLVRDKIASGEIVLDVDETALEDAPAVHALAERDANGEGAARRAAAEQAAAVSAD
ncbi:UNVERIFIED_ORG: putative ester cyclase [Arthrobacter sp. UYEF10]